MAMKSQSQPEPLRVNRFLTVTVFVDRGLESQSNERWTKLLEYYFHGINIGQPRTLYAMGFVATVLWRWHGLKHQQWTPLRQDRVGVRLR